ncbi:hypothetical protein Fcan01_28495 [Folsomia candida]|uniref:Uncharacterized protein n=1 Tax=Folsomia candida TaxID=158441 RepID=A0A226CVF3_FOLCA|nr:hypothetical protein Fcan01_28495 [Folsomia candida]
MQHRIQPAEGFYLPIYMLYSCWENQLRIKTSEKVSWGKAKSTENRMDYYRKVRSQFGSWYSLGIPYGQVTAGTCQIFDILRLVFVFHQRATLGYNIQLLLPPPPTAPPPS